MHSAPPTPSPGGPAPRRSAFAFAVCQPGAERWLERELLDLRPDLRPAWRRPGILSFKAMSEPFGPDEAPEALFARAWGCSAGLAEDAARIVEIAREVGATRLFLGPRDQGLPGEVAPARQRAADAHAEALRAEILSVHRLDAAGVAPGETVLDVITSPDEPSLVGWHSHGPRRHKGPCGRYTYEIPPEAPSRAYAKLVEGLLWSGARLQRGDAVLEIGAAPGGATLALLERGARVLAVDRNPLDPRILGRPGLTWLQRTASDLRREDLPRDLRWMLCDANIPPAHAVRAVQRLLPAAPRLRGLLLTLKLNDEAAVASLPGLLAGLRGEGFQEVRGTQLPANRRDLFVYARR